MSEQIECVGGPLDGDIIQLSSRRIRHPYTHDKGWVYTYRKGRYVFECHKKCLTVRRLFQMLLVTIWFNIYPVRLRKSVIITVRINHN